MKVRTKVLRGSFVIALLAVLAHSDRSCPASQALEYSAEKTGVRRIPHGLRQYEIPWYRVRADYNSIETADFWSKLRSLPGTKTAYVGKYYEMTWCERHGDGSRDQVAAWGVDFSLPSDDHFRVKPGPGKVLIRRFLFEEQEPGDRMAFDDGRYYVFCLDREPVEQWRSVSNHPGCDLDTELEHLVGIIEVEPTFELDERSPSPALHVTRESLLAFRHERRSASQGYEQEYAVVRKEDGTFRLEAQGLANASAERDVIQKLLYAVNTCTWMKQSGRHEFEVSPPVTRAVLVYRDERRQLRKVTISYDMGGWYMDHFDSGHYSTRHPRLLHEVEADIRALCWAADKTRKLSSGPSRLPETHSLVKPRSDTAL